MLATERNSIRADDAVAVSPVGPGLTRNARGRSCDAVLPFLLPPQCPRRAAGVASPQPLSGLSLDHSLGDDVRRLAARRTRRRYLQRRARRAVRGARRHGVRVIRETTGGTYIGWQSGSITRDVDSAQFF